MTLLDPGDPIDLFNGNVTLKLDNQGNSSSLLLQQVAEGIIGNDFTFINNNNTIAQGLHFLHDMS